MPLQPLIADLPNNFLELGVDRDDTGFARLTKKAAQEGKPLDKTAAPASDGTCPVSGAVGGGVQRAGGGGCPFMAMQNREAKL